MTLPSGSGLPTIAIVLLTANVAFNIITNAALRVSARSTTWRDVLIWQVMGNLAGFVTVITLTGLLHYTPLSIAFPLTEGLSVLAVQVVAAAWLFRETFNFIQWIGTSLIVAGMFLIYR
jgi:multidrug transporter EmrE-like cation transporter